MAASGFRKLNKRIGISTDLPQNVNAVDASYANLSGEALRTAILDHFQQSIANVKNERELHQLITEFRASSEFKILAKGQGAVTRLFNLTNASVAAFEKICAEAEQHCAIKKGPHP